jgi:hypothetical protein
MTIKDRTTKAYHMRGFALVIEAVILFERYEQKDKSGKNDLALRLGNAQFKKKSIIT